MPDDRDCVFYAWVCSLGWFLVIFLKQSMSFRVIFKWSAELIVLIFKTISDNVTVIHVALPSWFRDNLAFCRFLIKLTARHCQFLRRVTQNDRCMIELKKGWVGDFSLRKEYGTLRLPWRTVELLADVWRVPASQLLGFKIVSRQPVVQTPCGKSAQDLRQMQPYIFVCSRLSFHILQCPGTLLTAEQVCIR